MRLNDPKRRRIGELPAYQHKCGYAALPMFSVWPDSKDSCSISAMLMVGYNEYAWVKKTILMEDLPSILKEFRIDPEKVLHDLFEYDVASPPLNIVD